MAEKKDSNYLSPLMLTSYKQQNCICVHFIQTNKLTKITFLKFLHSFWYCLFDLYLINPFNKLYKSASLQKYS